MAQGLSGRAPHGSHFWLGPLVERRRAPIRCHVARQPTWPPTAWPRVRRPRRSLPPQVPQPRPQRRLAVRSARFMTAQTFVRSMQDLESGMWRLAVPDAIRTLRATSPVGSPLRGRGTAQLQRRDGDTERSRLTMPPRAHTRRSSSGPTSRLMTATALASSTVNSPFLPRFGRLEDAGEELTVPAPKRRRAPAPS